MLLTYETAYQHLLILRHVLKKNSTVCTIFLVCSNYQLNHTHTNIKSQLTHEDVHTHKHTKQQHQSVVQVLWLELSGYKRIM